MTNSNLGVFKIGIYDLYTDFFIDYNPKITALNTLDAPTWLNLISMQPSTNFIRVDADYSMFFQIGTGSDMLPSKN